MLPENAIPKKKNSGKPLSSGFLKKKNLVLKFFTWENKCRLDISFLL